MILAMKGKGEIGNIQVFNEIPVIKQWKRFYKKTRKQKGKIKESKICAIRTPLLIFFNSVVTHSTTYEQKINIMPQIDYTLGKNLFHIIVIGVSLLSLYEIINLLVYGITEPSYLTVSRK